MPCSPSCAPPPRPCATRPPEALPAAPAMSPAFKVLGLLPWADWLVLASFFVAWVGYALFAKRRAERKPSILGTTNLIRRKFAIKCTTGYSLNALVGRCCTAHRRHGLAISMWLPRREAGCSCHDGGQPPAGHCCLAGMPTDMPVLFDRVPLSLPPPPVSSSSGGLPHRRPH